MTTSLFLSHAAADLDLVRKVEAHAKPLDVLTYMYEDDLAAGSPLAQKLEDRIRGADAVIVLLTRNSEQRASVHAEIGIARALKKPIIPVIEVGVDPMQFVFLQGIQFITLDLTRLDEALLAIQHSIRRIKQVTEDHPLAVAGVLLLLAAIIYVLANGDG